ncbi:MAG: plasmid mobilization relaxosome protein MobC [Eubacteriales bacterium]|nr:plasmid mobilization relaxosome protein MobC [Eubacteriales bacterium]
MARPKKEKELKHTHRIYLRLTDTEYEIVTTNAKNANLPLAEYARKQVMNKKVIVKYELVADLPELKKLIAEFGKIGSNLNQIARHFNSGGIHSQEMRKAINQSITRIYEMKYEVLKLAGDFTTAAKQHGQGNEGDLNGNPETRNE